MTTETHLLEMLGHGAPMLEVLNELCNFVDVQTGAITTVFLLDNNGIRLRAVAGPKAPKAWKEEIDNVEGGPYAEFSSDAGDQGRTLTLGDINGDPLFSVHREAALREGLQMACFRPILSVEKEVRGALAVAYPQRQPRPEPDSEMMERAIQNVERGTDPDPDYRNLEARTKAQMLGNMKGWVAARRRELAEKK